MNKKLVLAVLLLAVCGTAYAVSQKVNEANKKNPYAFVYQVDVELLVDGKLMTLSKQAGCLVENYSKAGGDKFGYVKPTGIAVSENLPSGEVVIAAVPSGCKRFRKVATGDPEHPVKYEISKPLPKGFLPMMAIADKAGVPDELEMYASAYAYAAPAARLKLISINMKALAPGTEFEPDAFDWLLRGGHNGPVYVGFSARKAIKIPGMDELFDKHVPQREGVVKIFHREPGSEWFFNWIRSYMHNNGNDMMPANMMQVVGHYARGQNVHPSEYGGHYMSFKLDEGQNMLDKTPVTVRHYPEHNGIIHLYRVSFSVNSGGGSYPDDDVDVTYVFPSGEQYKTNTGMPIALWYDSKGRELYKRIPLRFRSDQAIGVGLEKYNKPGRPRKRY